MGKLDGKIALVTGASKGIGAGIALSLAKEGSAVAVNYASDRKGADRVGGSRNSFGLFGRPNIPIAQASTLPSINT